MAKKNACDEASPGESANAKPLSTLDGTADLIWRMSAEVMELLRADALREVRKEKAPGDLWLDDLTHAQGNALIAVKEMCEVCPEGTTLKGLAERTGVSSAAASVMVESLVQKNLLERHRAVSDRRLVCIRLSPETSRLFDVGDRSLRQTILDLADTLGPAALERWRELLEIVLPALRHTGLNVGGPSRAE